MTQSMTGYSRVVRPLAHGHVIVELRSTNHRFVEVDARLPNGLTDLSGEAVQRLRRHIRRGRIELTVVLQGTRLTARRVVFDDALAQAYYEQLAQLQARFGLRGPVRLEHVLALPLLFSVTEDHTPQQALWPAIRRAVDDGVRALVAMRRREGRRLVQDLRTHAARIQARVRAIRTQRPARLAQQQHRTAQRLKALMGNGSPMTASQIREALALVKDVDIHEELVRLESHLTQARQTLTQRAVGKKLDFLAQELMREANTLGAKANDARIAGYVVDIKEAIEKIREQAQNLE